MKSESKDLLKEGVKFHGHLGPYLALGLRMGIVAVRVLKPKGLHEMSVRVWTKKTPPQSCLLDGIQVSSGCTLGKGNVSVQAVGRVSATFRRGRRSVTIEPTANITALLAKVSKQSPARLRETARVLYRMPDRELFTTTYSD
jgi:formylmethanofuran dehydrogenase subunit E